MEESARKQSSEETLNMEEEMAAMDEKKFVSIWGSHSSLNKLSAKSRSNNDLLNIDKNSDTASLHSLPVMDIASSSSNENNLTDNHFEASFTSSPLSSPTHENNDLPGSSSISPSESFDRSIESLNPLEKAADDAPPPLPVKSRSLSLNSSGSHQTKNSVTSDQELPRHSSDTAIGMFSDKLYTFDAPDKSVTLPAGSKTTEPLKPPQTENRNSPVLPPPSVASSRILPTSSASLPRPKPGQLVAPPPSGSSHRQAINTSSSTSSVTGQSSFSDLLDINFSSTVPTLSPITTENENITSRWINPENCETDLPRAPIESQTLTVDRSLPPIIPKRGAFQLQTPVTATAASIVNPVTVDRAIPIAVAFIETVNGVFKGSDENSCVIRVTGDMTISFPANIISMLSNNPLPPVLSFLVTGTSSLEQIFPNKALVERGGQLPGGEGMTFKFNMVALAAYLKKLAEQGAKASYYNIDILKYQVRCNGMNSAPLQLSAYWRCDSEQTDLKIDYQYNGSCMSSPVALNNVSVVVPVDGGVTVVQSKPTAVWSSEHQRCMWKLAAISTNVDNAGANALRARFDITRGPTTPVAIAVQFTGEGTTISLLNFDLSSPSYKLSLVKKRFASGKYVVESS